MSKFKIGDRVRALGKVDDYDLKGKVGTVKCFADGSYDVGVEFDECFPKGHSCQGAGKMGHCRYGDENEFELVNEQKIVITADGKKTLARLYDGDKVIKSATAKCVPNDKFDFATGAKLAFERLMTEEKEPKIEIGKKYRIKPYDEVRDHFGIGKYPWDHIVKEPVLIKSKRPSGIYACETCFEGTWYISSEAFIVDDEKKASKFKVGDKVVGNKKADDKYAITKQSWIGYVIEILDGNEIRVSENADDKSGYSVDADCFDKVEEKVSEPEHGGFCVGDRVKVITKSHAGAPTGAPGTIIGFIGGSITVEFDDKFVDGHDGSMCGVAGKMGHCWHYSPGSLMKIEERKFKVGDHVRCTKGLGCGKRGVIIHDDGTNCAPFRVKWEDNSYTWKFGDRLEKIEPAKYLTGKFVFIGKHHIPRSSCTVGKVYEFKDGRTTDDRGNEIPGMRPVKDLSDCLVKDDFIPFKG